MTAQLTHTQREGQRGIYASITGGRLEGAKSQKAKVVIRHHDGSNYINLQRSDILCQWLSCVCSTTLQCRPTDTNMAPPDTAE